MGVKPFNVMDFGKTSLLNPEQLGYQDSIDIIKDESIKIQKSFVKIGWYLKHIRDNELYKEDGYENIWECAADQLGYSQSTASRFINICEKFSKGHNSPELDIKYAGFDKSQMIEMLPMEQEQLDKVTPDMTVKEIRDIKMKNKTPEPPEDMKTNDDIPGQTSIEKDFPEYLPGDEADDGQDKITPDNLGGLGVLTGSLDFDFQGVEAKIEMSYGGVYHHRCAVMLTVCERVGGERFITDDVFVGLAAGEIDKSQECRTERNKVQPYSRHSAVASNLYSAHRSGSFFMMNEGQALFANSL